MANYKEPYPFVDLLAGPGRQAISAQKRWNAEPLNPVHFFGGRSRTTSTAAVSTLRQAAQNGGQMKFAKVVLERDRI